MAKNRLGKGSRAAFRKVLALGLFFITLAGLSGLAKATVTVTTNTNAATLASAIAAGNSGITLTGTPVLSVGSSTTSSGTFSTTGSNLGIASGIVISTGNVTQIAGTAPGPGNISNNGSGVSNSGTNEFDIATFTFSFIPKPGVNRMSIASVFTSEEYNEYVNTNFTDNFSMLLSGGAYSNTNIATIPGTSVGTDINSVNNGSNAGYYRDNTVTPYPIPDIRYDGATTVFINAFNVVPGTTYTLTIRIADVADNAYDSSAFISTSTVINNPPSLDLSAALSGTGYANTWVQGSAPAPIAAADATIADDGTTISSATITLNSPVATDVLSVIGTLPGGITASAYNPTTGVITLSGTATLAQYQTALTQIGYSSTATSPTGPKTVNVIVNDGVDNSNTAVATISIGALSLTKSASAPTTALGTSTTLTDAGDKITYTYVVTNNSAVTLTTVSPVDTGPKFNGANGTGTMSAFSPASTTLAPGASATFTATYTLSAADVTNGGGIPNGVVNTAKATGKDPGNNTVNSGSATATTTISSVAALSVTKTASAPSIAAGTSPNYTDAGDTITYTYVVKNVGSVTLTTVSPTDAGPQMMNGVGTNAAGTGTMSAFSPASVASLAPGASQTFTATYTLSAADITRSQGVPNGVSNSATAKGNNGATVITSPASTAKTTIPITPLLKVTKSAAAPTVAAGANATLTDAGDTITYTYVVTNIGNVPLTNVAPTDAGPKFNGVAGTGTLSAFTPASASLAVNAAQTFTATYTLSAADVQNAGGITNGVTNTASATGFSGSTPITAPNASASTSITTVAALSVTKTAGTPTVAAGLNATLTDAGDTITFTYVVKNIGSVTLTAVAPTDAGPKFNGTAGTNALGAFSPASVASLAAGATATFTATYALSATDVQNAVGISNGVTNTAGASGKNGAVTVTANPSSASTTIPAVPSLAIAKTYVLTDIAGGNAGKADLNETITYSYVVTNNGNVPMTNISVKDMHGTPAVQVSLGAGGITSETLTTAGPLGAAASPDDGTAGNGIWGTLAPGASVTFTWPHTVTQAEIDHG